MTAIKDSIKHKIEQLNEEQLKQIDDFIDFIKFRDRRVSLTIDENQIAALYREFAEEDQKMAEEGIGDYAELLSKEDLQ